MQEYGVNVSCALVYVGTLEDFKTDVREVWSHAFFFFKGLEGNIIGRGYFL